jgi:hypothetical protein
MSRKTNKATSVASLSPDSDKQPESLEEAVNLLKALSAEFTNFQKKIDSMETKLSNALLENSKLHTELKDKTKVISDLQRSYSSLKVKLNNLEQYNRS